MTTSTPTTLLHRPAKDWYADVQRNTNKGLEAIREAAVSIQKSSTDLRDQIQCDFVISIIDSELEDRYNS